MPDLRLVLVDYDKILKHYEPIGLLGKGVDEILNISCQNEVVMDIYEGRLKIQQNYQNLNQQQFRKKLDQLNRCFYEDYCPHQTQIEMISYLKKEEQIFDLIVIYNPTIDISDLEETDNEELVFLNKELERRRKNNEEGLTVDQVKNLVSIFCEQLFIGSKFSHEYLGITPENILYQAQKGRQFILTNLNLRNDFIRYKYKYHNKSDEIYQSFNNKKELLYSNKTGQQLVRNVIFKMGMIALECLSLQPITSFYDQNDLPSQSTISKVLREVKAKVPQDKHDNVQFLDALEQFLQVNEYKRLNLDNLMAAIYYRGDLEGYGYYQGYFKKVDDKIVPDGVGQCVYQLEVPNDQEDKKEDKVDDKMDDEQEDKKDKDDQEQDTKSVNVSQKQMSSSQKVKTIGWTYKGQFVEGLPKGRGIMYDNGYKYISGWFEGKIDETIKDSQIIYRNKFIYKGDVHQLKANGNGKKVVLNSNQDDELIYVQGEFKDDVHVRKKCNLIYRNGKEEFENEDESVIYENEQDKQSSHQQSQNNE